MQYLNLLLGILLTLLIRYVARWWWELCFYCIKLSYFFYENGMFDQLYFNHRARLLDLLSLQLCVLGQVSELLWLQLFHL